MRSAWIDFVPGVKYDHVNAKWYAEIAAPLLWTVVLNYVSAPLIYLAFTALPSLFRLIGGKKLTQNQLNASYAPPEFYMSAGYAEMLVGVTVTLIYGSGVPLLYVISAVGLALQYATTKYLVLRFYKKPPLFAAYSMQMTPNIIMGLLLVHAAFSSYFISMAGGTNPVESLCTGDENETLCTNFKIRPAAVPMFVCFCVSCVIVVCMALRRICGSNNEFAARRAANDSLRPLLVAATAWSNQDRPQEFEGERALNSAHFVPCCIPTKALKSTTATVQICRPPMDNRAAEVC
eukprot:SAG31_NODE_1888_length_6987_cov_1.481852_1_plen_291_part_00